MQDTTRKMDGFVDRRKEGIKTPEYATQLVNGFRSTVVDFEGEDALAKCKKITAALVGIGGNQDELVGECRMVVKILRKRRPWLWPAIPGPPLSPERCAVVPSKCYVTPPATKLRDTE